VKEVMPGPPTTVVPNVDSSILGVFNLRGQIYSLVDMAELLMLKKDARKTRNIGYVVILEHEDFSLGIAVDRVMDVIVIDSDKIQIPSRELPLQIVQFSNGYYKHEVLGEIYLIDVPTLMNAKEIRQYRF
jgi:purine-binding chemotaxis protein CheW